MIMRFKLACLIAGAAISCARRVVRHTLDLTNGNVSPDGFSRPAVLVNGRTPGPIISATKGDELVIRVNNRLSDTRMPIVTTIHWHGILQHKAAHQDGVPFVTQCPIVQNESYTYHIATGDQTGTYWYHSHMSLQYLDGLRGALIIYDPDSDDHRGLYDIDDHSTVISLTDWYHNPADQLRVSWMSDKIPEPAPDSNLFNGVGRYRDGPATPRAVLNVEHGKRYRLRLINMGAAAIFNFTVERHPITVIEADGVNHHPSTVSALTINAGQRYSVILNANQTIGNYWIAYPGNFRDILVPNVNPNFNGSEAFAVLRYKGARDVEPESPTFQPDLSDMLIEQKLRPLHSPQPPTDIPVVVNITYRPVGGGGELNQPGGAKKWLVNSAQFIPPTIPVLLDILSGSKKINQSDPSAGIYVLPRNRTIYLRLVGDEHHPFHLHGHNFQVVQSAEGPRNEIDPPIRDTVVSNNGTDKTIPGPVTIRFRTDNPGPWLLHCHKDWHLEAGLAVVFVESPDGQRSGNDAIKPNPEWRQLCTSYFRFLGHHPDTLLASEEHSCTDLPCIARDNKKTQQIITHDA